MNKPHENSSVVAIALMVKNEAPSIWNTLMPMYEAGFQDFFILDTGSTDNTIQIATNFFKQHKLNGHIKQEPFIDFATSRNRTLELAEELFPDIEFLLMPDAEWHLHNGAELLNFCKQEQHNTPSLYSLNIKMNHTEFATTRLFRTRAKIRFKGVVHEVPEILAQGKVPPSIFFEVNATQQGVEKSKKRWQQDLFLLLKAYYDNPQDPRTTFYLAQTYACLGDFENAYRYYLHRSTLEGWDEENYVTQFRLGTLAMEIKHPTEEAKWAAAMNHYLKAHGLRPHRIEPLVKIADYYWPDNIPSCYLFAKSIYDTPYPVHDVLFIEKEMYEYTRYEILSRCAWYLGQYQLGKEATERALQVRPGTTHLINNLALYDKALNPDSEHSR